MTCPEDPLWLRFTHDRVLQAATALTSESKRAALNLRIGRNLMRAWPTSQRTSASLFSVVRHLNAGTSDQLDPEEHIELAQLNGLAAEYAQTNGAVDEAVGYLRHALRLLSERCWEEHYDLSLRLHSQYAVCARLSGRYQAAQETFDTLVARATSSLDRARIAEKLTAHYVTTGDSERALQVAREALAELGLVLPETPDAVAHALAQEMAHVSALTREQDRTSLIQMPPLTDPRTQLQLKLLFMLFDPTILKNPPLHGLLTFRIIRISLDSGLHELTPLGCITACAYLLEQRQFRQAHELARLGLEVSQHLKQPGIACAVQFGAGITSHFSRPLREALVPLATAIQLGLDVGDFRHMSYASSHLMILHLSLGTPLAQVLDEVERLLNLIFRLGIDRARAVI